MPASLLRLALSCTLFWALVASAAQNGEWIGTWTASPQPLWDMPAKLRIPAAFDNQTIRQIAKISLGGKRVRIVVSNAYGTKPLFIGEAHVALSAGGAQIVAGSDHKLTFGGKTAIAIPPGAPVMSDPVELEAPVNGNLAITLFLPQDTPATTFHWDGLQTGYVATGNLTAAEDIKPAYTTRSRMFLSEILVDNPSPAYAIVALGDSITEGNATTPDANQRWPDLLALRLQGRVSVLNAGISGARLLGDRLGSNALARFERDVLAQPRVKTVILLIGINDICWPKSSMAPDDELPTLDDLIAGYRQLITRAHVHGIRIIGGTLTAFQNAFSDFGPRRFHTEEKEQLRQAVNKWIRTSGEFDGVIDFDAMTRDPKFPMRLLSAYDSGDHLHPNDAGNKAMADGIDLKGLLP